MDEMHKQVELIANLRAEEAAIGAQKKAVSDQLELEEHKMMAMLDEIGEKSFKCSLGTVTKVVTMRAAVPKTHDDKKALFDYLQTKELYWDTVNINSQRLQSFVKDELEQAKARGDVTYQIPGVSELSPYTTLSFRRG